MLIKSFKNLVMSLCNYSVLVCALCFSLSLLLASACKPEGEAPKIGDVGQAIAGDCSAVLAALAENPTVANVECFVSSDLTTANPETTPPDNSLPGLPPNAFVPRSDAANTPGSGPESRYPITTQVPGLQISGTMADDAGARWVIRLPDTWNGRLFVGIAAGLAAEYGQDIVFSNYMVQHGYAYVGSNKGHLKIRATTADDPKACASAPGASSYIHTFLSDLPPEQGFPGYARRILEATAIAKDVIVVQYGSGPQYTYVGGNSIGATVSRRLAETNPETFDGALGWAPPYVTAEGRPDGTDDRRNHANFNNLIGNLPVVDGLRNFPAYRDSEFDQTSAGYLALRASFFPPDFFGAPNPPSNPSGSFYGNNYGSWYAVECGNVRSIDPVYQPPAGELRFFRDYDYPTRYREAGLRHIVRGIGSTGRLRRPLIELHGTRDGLALLRGTRLYVGDVKTKGRSSCHRVYEVESGSHSDRVRDPPFLYEQIEPIGLKLIAAFERLVSWVEQRNPAPPSQCIPQGGSIVNDPGSLGRPTFCSDGNPIPPMDDDNHDDDDDCDHCVRYHGNHDNDDQGNGAGDRDRENDN